jgi:spore coat polysaccharide biosynthesis predicted glycosyltransferase SpsG
MGHVFRGLNLADALRKEGLDCFFVINNDQRSIEIIQSRNFIFEVVCSYDDSTWEAGIIQRRGVCVWVNDRLNTSERHATALKELNIGMVTFDDLGYGARWADLHVAALPGIYKKNILAGNKILTGTDYLILNPEIRHHRRVRKNIEKILVSLGGSDTYGVTVTVARILKQLGITPTILLGPNFQHRQELSVEIDGGFCIKEAVPSMILELAKYDLAITGGGITPFEANALGLPCIIIANEVHEIENAEYLESLGCSLFAGYYEQLRPEVFTTDLDIETMSNNGLTRVPCDGAAKIAQEIKEIWRRQL